VGTTNGEVLLSMNNQRAPFDDPDIRRAVAYAIDRDAINEVVYNGLATDTGGAPVPPTDPWFTGHNYYPFDPDKARELLAGRTPEVTITVPNLPYAQTASELIFSQLRDVGFNIKLETVEFPAVWL
ncbi:ABC transporter substrate-binding protein, partial [Corynebacterium sp. HMSC034B08]